MYKGSRYTISQQINNIVDKKYFFRCFFSRKIKRLRTGHAK